MKRNKIDKLVDLCGFTKTKTYVKNWRGDNEPTTVYGGKFIKPKKDLYFEVVNMPSRKGSIGRLTNLTIVSYGYLDNVSLEFDGRPKIVNFDGYRVEWLPDYNGPTVYNFFKKEKKIVPPHTNKFGQTLYEDDLIVGIGGTSRYGPQIVFGYVSRWTKSTIFVKPYGPFGSVTNKTKGDVQLKSISEIIKLPKDAELEKDLFSCVLSSSY